MTCLRLVSTVRQLHRVHARSAAQPSPQHLRYARQRRHHQGPGRDQATLRQYSPHSGTVSVPGT